MTTMERGPPLVIGPTAIEGPAWLLSWVSMVEGCLAHGSYISPTSTAAQVINTLLAAGWTAPNAYTAAESAAINEAAREVADMVWRTTTCSDDERAGITTLTLEAIHRYRKLLT